MWGVFRNSFRGLGSKFAAAAGSVAAPSYTWGSDPDTGVFSPGPNKWAISVGGVEIVRVTAAGLGIGLGGDPTQNLDVNGIIASRTRFSSVSPGSAAAAAYGWGSDGDTGPYWPAVDNYAIVAGGVEVGRFAKDGSGNVQYLAAAAGSASAPVYSWGADPDTGVFSSGAGRVSFAANGALAGEFVADASVADGSTALLVRRNVGGTYSLQQVSMGAADSGGAGFKVLRVPN